MLLPALLGLVKSQQGACLQYTQLGSDPTEPVHEYNFSDDKDKVYFKTPIKIDEKNKGWCILLDANLTKNDQIGVNDKEAEHNVYLNPFLGKIQNNNIAGNVAILNEVNGTDTTSASDEKNFKYLSVYYN